VRNKEVVALFLKGRAGHSLNVHSNGEKLWSYNTVIAQRIDGVVVGNATKYSSTTSHQMSPLKPYVEQWTTKRVPRGTQDLTDYI